ncbi:sigma-70 family RNA polymerase sigma factor [Wenzhouxiangella limi]|uniref:Sigma-70 family RNA polymerase sigma factor n=1 Tax=Wenzhouxiangella limi TaxID=2707351 RepID=A0A845UXS0_9GAMM|nr:sigma-70 family RNA polymerase sigma factor [Wenzhouxiangella limi]NDY96653.1 sigma-70 family RNA polymerase sigma factor [Wenzhouxiangella limi]
MPANHHTARFEDLVESHADDLFRFGCWLTGDREVAQDLVQETMIRAWRSIDQLRDAGAVKPWLLTTLRRENARRFERKRFDLVDIEDQQVTDSDQVDAETRILHSQIRVEVDQLPKKYAEPLRLQAYLGCSIAEITERLGISRSAAMTRVHRARQHLKNRLSADRRIPDLLPA